MARILKSIRFHILLLLLVFTYFSGIASVRNSLVNIGVFNVECGSFEVNLKPSENINSYLTNLQFTLKWQQNTVELINFSSEMGLVQQGPVYTSDNYNYAVFAVVPSVPNTINWLAGEEYAVLTFEHDQSGNEGIDMLIAHDSWASNNNGEYYLELLGSDYTGDIYHEATGVYSGSCMDIGLFNPFCGYFEVKLKPGANVSSYLTNVQFTLKWPENSVEFINFSSDYEIEQQGPVYTEYDYNYAVFAGTPMSSGLINWNADQEYTIMSFEHDQSGTDSIDVEITQDNWAVQHNGLYYAELLGTDASGITYHQADSCYTGECSKAFIKVLLQGAWDESVLQMRTSINAAGNFSTQQPYDTIPWEYSGEESVSTLPDSLTDWVMVELRDKNDPSVLITRRAALLSKNGIVLETDLSSGIRLEADNDNYYIVVRHRNHISVMSGSPVTLPNDGEPCDFTEIINTQPYQHNDPLPVVLELQPMGSGIYGIIAGDVNADNTLKYVGTNNDRGLILNLISTVSGNNSLNTTIQGYYNEDVTLNDIVQYLSTGNDRGIILNNLWRLTGSDLINEIYEGAVPETNPQYFLVQKNQ